MFFMKNHWIKIHIFLGLKKIKLCWYELGKRKMCTFQHHLNVFFEKSLDLDYKNGLSSTLLK